MNIKEKNPFFLGTLVSLVGHLLAFAIALLWVEFGEARAKAPTEVFTVTLEGGEVLGGKAQVPTLDDGKKKAEGDKNTDKAVQPLDTPEITPPKEIQSPTVLEENKKAEEAKKLAEEKKKQDLEKKKAEEEKKKKAEEEKKKAADDAKKKTEDDKKQLLKERAAREQKLKDAIKKYSTAGAAESYNAGGVGLGAAALGGKGRGGGTLASIEFIAYQNELEAHIKSGWHWVPTAEHYVAVVEVSILPDGQVQQVRMAQSSGNGNFDESVLRAVYKSSPVPPPPGNLYDKFRVVNINFDSNK